LLIFEHRSAVYTLVNEQRSTENQQVMPGIVEISIDPNTWYTSQMINKAIFLMGPTATGKTALALQLAQILPVDIISVDSAMVYRGLDIGTGKPTAEQLAHTPHQLIDICDPNEIYSVAQFCADATHAMNRSWQQQRIPLLVGGTMLYFKALQYGIAPLPSADAALRTELTQQAEQVGWPQLHTRLAQLDPVTAQRLGANDAQRIQRALEINLLTGKTLQELFQNNPEPQLNYKLHSFAITPQDRTKLHQKIAIRFMQMLESGFIAEVEKLYKRGDLNPQLPAIRSVGYRQIWNYLADKTDYTLMCDQAIAATRQLAKRQFTWLRSWENITHLDNSSEMVLDTIVNSVLDSGNN
jgi:tRNA dimethylallyltransferase